MIRFCRYSFTILWTILALTLASMQTYAGPLNCAGLLSSQHTRSTLAPGLIEEVVLLEDKAEIPARIFGEFEVNDIARSIVERVRRQELEYKNDLTREDHSEVDTFLKQILSCFLGEETFNQFLKRVF